MISWSVTFIWNDFVLHMLMCWDSIWLYQNWFSKMKRERSHLNFFLYNYRLVLFLCMLLSLCLFKHMLRLPKISSKPNESVCFLSPTTSANSSERFNPRWQSFAQKCLPLRGGGYNYSDFCGICSDEEAMFSVTPPLPPPPSLQNISWTRFFFFF